MEKRTKLGLKKDKMYKALGEGERTSKKVSTIRMSDGSTFKRKNANRYGEAEGGNDYTEKRSNRTDRFDLGGTADSSNTGANMGGTMGSSLMKKGGNLIGKQKNLDLNKNGKLDAEDFKMIRGEKKRGGGTKSEISHYKVNGHIFIDYDDAMNYCDKNKLPYSKIIKTKKYAKGGLSDLPENPSNDAMSYKTGGAANDYYEELAVYVQGVGSIYNGTSMKKAIDKANSYLKKNAKAEIVISDEKYGDTYDLNGNMIEDEMAKGGSTKSFEYTIGGL